MKNKTIRRIAAGIFSAVMVIVALPQTGSVKASAANLYPNAKKLRNNAPLTETVEHGDTAVYKYTVTERGKVNFCVITQLNRSSEYVYLYDGKGKLLEMPKLTGRNSYISKTYSKKLGTVFYLKIGPVAYGEAAWSVICNFSSSDNKDVVKVASSGNPDNDETVSEVDETEPNDSYNEANRIRSGHRMYGVLDNYSDYDTYSFTAPSNGRVSFTLANADSNAGSAWNMWVCGSSFTAKLRASAVSSNQYLIKKGTTVYILVSNTNRYSDGRRYALTADFKEISDKDIIEKISSNEGEIKNLSSRKNSVSLVSKNVSIVGAKAGYQAAIKKSGASDWKYKTSSGTKISFGKLKRKTGYIVKVRAFVTLSGKKHYGMWSVEDFVTTK